MEVTVPSPIVIPPPNTVSFELGAAVPMPTLPEEFMMNKPDWVEVPISRRLVPVVEVQSSNKAEGVVVPMPTLPVLVILILSVLLVAK